MRDAAAALRFEEAAALRDRLLTLQRMHVGLRVPSRRLLERAVAPRPAARARPPTPLRHGHRRTA
jgi:hypothetical protein